MYPPCCAIGCDLEQWIHGVESTLNGMETRSSGIQIMTLDSSLPLPSKRRTFRPKMVDEVTLVPESVVEKCPPLRYSKNEIYALTVHKRTQENLWPERRRRLGHDEYESWMDPELQYYDKFEIHWRNPQYVANDDDFWGRHAGFFGWICHNCIASTMPKVETWINNEKEEAEERLQAMESRKSREDDSASYVKAGIPESIVSFWVEGKLEEKQMLGLLSIFRESLGEWDEILTLKVSQSLAGYIDPGKKVKEMSYFVSDFLNDANELFELAKTHTLEWIYHFVKHRRNSNDIQFIAEITGNEEFFFLELVLLNEEFPFSEAKNLYQNCGFDDRPDALREVLNGANWKAVAVKHGFFQL